MRSGMVNWILTRGWRLRWPRMRFRRFRGLHLLVWHPDVGPLFRFIRMSLIERPPLGVWMTYLVDWRRLWITRFIIGMRYALLIGVVGSTIGDSQQVMFNCITWWGFFRRWVGMPLMGLLRWSRFRIPGFMARSGLRYQCVG